MYDIEKYFILQKFVLNTWWLGVFVPYWRCNHIKYKTRHTEYDACLVNLHCSLKMIVCKYLQVRDTRSVFVTYHTILIISHVLYFLIVRLLMDLVKKRNMWPSHI